MKFISKPRNWQYFLSPIKRAERKHSGIHCLPENFFFRTSKGQLSPGNSVSSLGKRDHSEIAIPICAVEIWNFWGWNVFLLMNKLGFRCYKISIMNLRCCWTVKGTSRRPFTPQCVAVLRPILGGGQPKSLSFRCRQQKLNRADKLIRTWSSLENSPPEVIENFWKEIWLCTKGFSIACTA